MKNFFKKFFLIFLILIIILLAYLFIGQPKPQSNIVWGVNFSQKQAISLGLDWQKTFLAILDDLKVRHLRIATYWDLLESEDGKYNFSDLDWQVNEAIKRGAQLILAIGLKTPRWPECHLPTWASNLSPQEQQEKINDFIKQIVLHYQNEKNIIAWQIENEAYFPFGKCPKRASGFLDEEIKLVKSLDNRPVILTDSGEWSMWFKMAKKADVVGISLYRRVYSTTFSFLHKIFPFIPEGFYLTYPFPPKYFYAKAKLIEKIFHKPVIVAELQAESWLKSFTTSAKEQSRTMDFEKLKETINFAQHTGLNQFYFWGAEWWYWLKTSQNNSQIWDLIKNLLNS